MKQNELIEVVTSGHCIFNLVPLFLRFFCVTRSCVTNTRVFQDIHPMTSAEKPWWFARCCCFRVLNAAGAQHQAQMIMMISVGLLSPLPSVQFFILQYGRRCSMIFSNTSQKGCNSPPTIWKNPRWNCWGRKLDETATVAYNLPTKTLSLMLENETKGRFFLVEFPDGKFGRSCSLSDGSCELLVVQDCSSKLTNERGWYNHHWSLEA